jgi:hypothetical protein
VDWIGLAKDMNRWRAVVNSVLNLRVQWNAGKRTRENSCTLCVSPEYHSFSSASHHQHRDHRSHRLIGCPTAKTWIIQGMTTYKIRNKKPKINKTATLTARKHQLKYRTTRYRPHTRIQTRKIGKRNNTESYHNMSYTEKIPTVLSLIHIYFNLIFT